jgi:dihydroflavonol-4-reductase
VVGDTDATVLVTGGTGFLGGWCVAELLGRGHDVRTTVRDVAREPAVRATVERAGVEAGDRLTVVAADLSADTGWAEAVAGCSHVLHVASPFPPEQPKDPDELIVPARDGDQACYDTIFFRPLGGITQPLLPWQNRPTFQQVVEVGAR